MAWPPPVLPTNRTNATPQQDTHPQDHNALAQAINDIVNKVQGVDEIFHATLSTAINLTATSAAGAQLIHNPGSVTYDGTPIMIEFYAPAITTPAVASGQIIINLWDTSTDLGWLTSAVTPAAGAITVPAFARRRVVPTAGLHSYSIRGWVFPSGTGAVQAGSGASWSPSYMRVTRA